MPDCCYRKKVEKQLLIGQPCYTMVNLKWFPSLRCRTEPRVSNRRHPETRDRACSLDGFPARSAHSFTCQYPERSVCCFGPRRSSQPVEHGKHFEYLSMGMCFSTLKGWWEREREERKDGVLCGIVRCLSTKAMKEQLHNDPLWGGERCPGHGTAPSLGSATERGREMFIKPHWWARASSHWQGPLAWEAILCLCPCSVEVPWQGLQAGWARLKRDPVVPLRPQCVAGWEGQ